MSSYPPSLPLYKSPPPFQKPQPPPMAGEEGKWETFDDDDNVDTLSLIDLPITVIQKKQEDPKPSEEEFEFRTFMPKSEMCDADEIFSNGRLLRSFRQSSVGSQQSCRRSNSNSSHSSSSNSSSNHRRVTVWNNFYAHPSPKPQLQRTAPARRSTGSAPPGWALFRVGLVKTPEIELEDIRSRRMRGNNGKRYDKPVSKLFGFGCNCSQDAVQPLPVNHHNAKAKKEKEEEDIMWRRRMSEWLEELSAGKRV